MRRVMLASGARGGASEPITINLNIKLDADVRLRVQEKAQEDVKSQSIF